METSTNSQTIQKALNILNCQDWHYAMVDCEYKRAYESAKASMRLFVEVTDTLPESIRTALRDLWKATCRYMKQYYPFHVPSSEDERVYTEARDAAMSVLNPHIA